MKRWFRRLARIVFFGIAASFILFAAGRIVGPPAAQREALALMQPSAMPGGISGVAALHLLAWPVPPQEMEALMAEELQALRNQVAAGTFDPSATSLAEQRHGPVQLIHPEVLPLCYPWESGCLDHIRARRDDYAVELARTAPLMQRAESLLRADHLFVPPQNLHESMLIPRNGGPAEYRMQQALDFVDGRTDQALAALCGDVGAWRRLAARTNHLRTSMALTQHVQGQARLFADMLAEMPPGTALPNTCDAAFAAPEAAELSMCEVSRAESHIGMRMLDVGPGSSLLDRILLWFAIDQDGTAARIAFLNANACRDRVADALTRDEPARLMLPELSAWRFECVGNAVGCLITSSDGDEESSFGQYIHRRQDLAAHLRLADTLRRLHLAGADTRPFDVRLRDADVSAASSPRRVMLGDAGDTLDIPLYRKARGAVLQMPLAMHLRNASSAASPVANATDDAWAQSAGAHSAK